MQGSRVIEADSTPVQATAAFYDLLHEVVNRQQLLAITDGHHAGVTVCIRAAQQCVTVRGPCCGGTWRTSRAGRAACQVMRQAAGVDIVVLVTARLSEAL